MEDGGLQVVIGRKDFRGCYVNVESLVRNYGAKLTRGVRLEEYYE